MTKQNVLYLSYNGLMEPLGRSQVLAYVKRLSKDFNFTIISFEKKSDLENTEELKALQQECEHYGITWQPKQYHHKPRLLATAFDMLVLINSIRQHHKSHGTALIHCRSYIPSIAAWVLGKFTKTPFIFDMRALWPEEMIEANSLKRDSITHKIIKFLEREMLRDAAHTVSLTQAAVNYLTKIYPEVSYEKYSVITTCVDLERFNEANTNEAPTQIGTMGTVLSGWYKIDWLFRTFEQQLKINNKSIFKIVTRDSKSKLQQIASNYNIPLDQLLITSSKPCNIAENISSLKVGLLYFTPGIAKLGSAPTRLGEFLASGIPVIGNRGVGDMASIIEQYNVGIILEDEKDESIKMALEQINILYNDVNLQKRCKDAAKDYFSADKGAEQYYRIYNRLI